MPLYRERRRRATRIERAERVAEECSSEEKKQQALGTLERGTRALKFTTLPVYRLAVRRLRLRVTILFVRALQRKQGQVEVAADVGTADEFLTIGEYDDALLI